MRAPRKSPDDRKEAIIEATAALLFERGLAAANTRAVAEKAGIGAGLLNRYFRWADLRASAWARIFEAVAERLFATDMAAPAAMERYFTESFSPDSPHFWQLWIEAEALASHDEAMATAVADARARMQEGLTALLRAGSQAGDWRLRDADGTAVRLAALNDGLVGQLLVGANGMDPAAAERHLRTAFALECAASARE